MIKSRITRIACFLLFFAVVCLETKAQEGEPVNPANNSANATLILGVTEVSLLKASQGAINLQLNQREAGMSIETSKSDSTSRLLMSSVISTDVRRSLSAKITSGVVPSGTQLQLVALQPNSNFVGDFGTIASPVALGETVDMPIVTDIATCYSGTDPSDGYPLKFIYALDSRTSYGSIRAQIGGQVVVTLTLTAAQ